MRAQLKKKEHNGIMRRGEGKLLVSVVPDSGTGELAGLDGIMNIRVTGGRHFYEFDYELKSSRRALD